MSFAILDTPEYKNIVDNMVSVSKCICFNRNTNYYYDIKSNLVFEFPCIAVDDKRFIIFEYNDEEITVHTHIDNTDILLAFVCCIYKPDYDYYNDFIKINNLTLTNIVGTALAKGGDHIEMYLGRVDFDCDDIANLVTQLRSK